VTFQTADQPTAAGHLRPYRSLIAFVLLGAAGLQLLRMYWAWLVPFGGSPPFDLRSLEAASQFTSVPALTLPLLAVLIATMVAPVVGQAKTITLIALAEYALTVLGAVIAVIVGTLALVTHPGGVLVGILIDRLVTLALLGLVVFVVLRIYLGTYLSAAPSAGYGGGYPVQSYPGYGQQAYPQPAAAGTYAGQPAHAAQHAQSAQATPQAPAQAAQQTPYAQQGQYGSQYGAQAPPTQQAPYGYGQQQTGQYPAAGYQTPPPTSVPPAPFSPDSGSGQEQAATQRYGAEPARPAAAWPPAPASQWPSPPAADTSSADDPSKTQGFQPEQHRGSTPG
jgi:hypothetical protein